MASKCNCCGSDTWDFVFSERGVNLGQCRECGLYYVDPMPTVEDRHSEVADGRFAGDQRVLDAEHHYEGEVRRVDEFVEYIDILSRFAPEGKWLEVGCGTGRFIQEMQKVGIQVEGIELTRERRDYAAQITGTTIHSEPIESLSIPDNSLAAVTLIYVFSHLTDPKATLRELQRVLKPGGVVLLRTGETGRDAKLHHAFDWNLGDHLFFLGENTIEHYAELTGFELIYREKIWEPLLTYSTEFFRTPGRSRIRNFAKRTIAVLPGALPLLRMYITKVRQRDNPIYTSTLVLRKSV